MKQLVLPSLLIAMALLIACGEPQNPVARAAGAGTVLPEVAAAARKLLGPDSEVLASGDLAHDGHEQALVVNRIGHGPKGSSGDILFWRASVLERHGARWTEVLRCDEYLKNAQGYLAGTPSVPVNGWRLRWKPNAMGKGTELYFTPLTGNGTPSHRTIQVLWNRRVARYQSLDEAGNHFLAEIPSLEIPAAKLR